MLPVNQLLPKIAVVAAFALSCFLLLVFLWSAFGGPVPLRAQGYRITASFDQATTLAVQAEVRISGVPVGRVVGLKATPDGLTRATIQLDPQYAPLPQDAGATLRAKSLAGETYVELSPGRPGFPPIPDGGQILQRNVVPTTQLDQALRALDPSTRAAFRVWQQQLALAATGRGRSTSDAIAQLAPLEEEATGLLTTLNRNSASFSRLVANTGVVFGAISARDHQLAHLIENSDRVFSTTGKLNRQLAATFVALPTFQRESIQTLNQLDRTAASANGLVTQLHGVAKEAGPTFEEAAKVAPELNELVQALGPLQEAGADGLPATDRVLGGLQQFTSALPPALSELTPILGYVNSYTADLTSFFVNVAAATQSGVILGDGTAPTHYLRTLVTLTPDQMAQYQTKLSSNRTNPYAPPGTSVTQQRTSIITSQCDGRPWPTLNEGPGVSPQTIENLRTLVFKDGTPIGPPCIQSPARGGGTLFPQLKASATPSIP